MRCSVLLFLFAGLGLNLSAQPFIDIVNIHYQKSPEAALYGKDKNPFSTDYFVANFNLPLKAFKRDRLIINPVFEWNHLGFGNQEYLNTDLYGLTMALSYVKQWKNDKWKTVFVSINRISSDLNKITIKHYQPGGALITIYERSKKVRYKLGVYYNSEFFGAYVLPLLGIEWSISDRLILHGLVPRNLVLEWRITPSLYAGINWRAITNSYRYRSEHTSDYFKIEENQVRLFADIYLTRHLVLNFETGHTFLREYNQRSELNRIVGLDSDLQLNEGLLFKAGIFYRIRLDDRK